MELVVNKRTGGILAIILLLAGAVWGVKHFCFPPLDEKFLQLDYNRLRAAPPNVFVFRPSRFAGSQRFGVISVALGDNPDYSKRQIRVMGHNATAREIIALAFQCRQSRVLMPADTPTNRYDFLVTTPKATERLQQAVLSKLGCSAQWDDNRDTEVLELRLLGFNAPGIHPDGPGEVEWQFTGDNNLHWTHAKIAWFADRIEQLFGKPVVDKTGLNDYYEFSFAWNWRGNYTEADRIALTNSIGELGLKLEAETDSVRMLVVEKNH